MTSPVDPARCGTEANYQRHRRLGETPCRSCTQTHARNLQDGRKVTKRKAS